MTIGLVVREYPPYWVVVQPQGESQYVVVDTSGPKPQAVSDPMSKAEAETICRINQQLWAAVYGQVAE